MLSLIPYIIVVLCANLMIVKGQSSDQALVQTLMASYNQRVRPAVS
jgi:hypothetical protein